MKSRSLFLVVLGVGDRRYDNKILDESSHSSILGIRSLELGFRPVIWRLQTSVGDRGNVHHGCFANSNAPGLLLSSLGASVGGRGRDGFWKIQNATIRAPARVSY